MEAGDLDNLVEDSARSFEPLRCVYADSEDDLEGTERMIALNNKTLVSKKYQGVMQWEITDDIVRFVRFVSHFDLIEWEIDDIFSLGDGNHFFLNSYHPDKHQTKVSLHHIDIHAPLCEIIIDHYVQIEELIPLSTDQILYWNRRSGELLVYSMKNPGQHHPLTLSDADFLDIKNLPGVNDLVVILYKHHIEIWAVTVKFSTLMNHYMLQSDYTAENMEVIDRSHIILKPTYSQEAKEITLLSLKEFNIVSETLMSNEYKWATGHPLSSNSVITFLLDFDEKNSAYVETYTIHSIVNNKQYTIATRIDYSWKITQFFFVMPNTLDIVLFSDNDHGDIQFLKYTIPQELAVHINPELRKNARILSQAHRTLSSHFARVPVEICLKIIALTDTRLPDDKARRLAGLYFCRPSCDIS